jgi:two-component system, OmpR family, response regulator MprA
MSGTAAPSRFFVGSFRPLTLAREAGAMEHGRVLVVEDDEHVREAVARALHLEGYDVHTAVDGNDALLRVDELAPDVVVLDVLMPGTDGLAVCRILRERGNRTPVLMLTARHEVSDRVAGLDAGADDYLVKPFALDELFARLRALLRRSSVTGGDTELRVGDLVLDPERRQAWRGERELTLTKTEFDLLELLMFNAGIVMARDTIYERIWGFDFETSSKSLDVYIGYLRRKTEAEGESRVVHTVRGVGYSARVA